MSDKPWVWMNNKLGLDRDDAFALADLIAKAFPDPRMPGASEWYAEQRRALFKTLYGR